MSCKCDFKYCALWVSTNGGRCQSTNTEPCESVPEHLLDYSIDINIVKANNENPESISSEEIPWDGLK